jgi:hypothetical protein
MKTVHKEYTNGFLIEPTKLTRIVDVIHQRLAERTSNAAHDTFNVFFNGNRREELTSLTDVLALDNSRRQMIVRLLITSTTSSYDGPRPDHEVQVDLGAPKPGSTSDEKLVTIDVRSDSTAWASRTLAEVEEQVERTWLQNSRPRILLVLLCIASSFVILFQLPSTPVDTRGQHLWLGDSDLVQIRPLVAPGRVLTDEEHRKIATTQFRNLAFEQTTASSAPALNARRTLFIVTPFLLVLGCCIGLLTSCYPNEVFLWGDETQRYALALQRRKALWGIIISVTIVGVLSNFLFAAWFAG